MVNYSFESTPNSLKSIEDVIAFFVAENSIANNLRNKIVISSIEAVTNSIFHGNSCDPTKQIRLNLEKRKNRVVVSIEDDGGGFNYDLIRNPTKTDSLSSSSGRGVFLMIKLSSFIEFNCNGNSVQLYFKL